MSPPAVTRAVASLEDQIGARLFISVRTVESHVSSLLRNHREVRYLATPINDKLRAALTG